MVRGFQDYTAFLPFPKVPSSTEKKNKYSYSDNLLLRPFGVNYDDLQIDFSNGSRPYLVTKVIRCCTINRNGRKKRRPHEKFFWDISIGKRIECLLIILALSESYQDDSISIMLKCSNNTCKKNMEVELSAAELANRQHQADEVDKIVVQISDEQIQFRKPVGLDQLQLLEAEYADYTTAEKLLIQRLLVPTSIKGPHLIAYDLIMSEESRHLIDNAMTEIDSLVNFSIPLVCPNCGTEDNYDIDLEGFALQKLNKIQRQVIDTIHTLALHYHWTEEYILAIPKWRRLQYLSLITKDGENLYL